MLKLLNQSTKPALATSNNEIYPDKQKTIVIDAIPRSSTSECNGNSQQIANLALFHREEINVGELVGTGSFSEVYEISSFDLIQSLGENDTAAAAAAKKRWSSSFLKTSTTSQQSQQQQSQQQPLHLDPSTRQKRSDMVLAHNQNAQDQLAGRSCQSRYVIKHLHQKLLQDPKLFNRAVRDLNTEATLMRDMNHPHIVRLRGSSLGGAAAMRNGRHDSFFLVLDRLYETLEDRIETWNQDKIQQGPSYYLNATTNEARLALKVNYAWQVASALQYLHNRRIIFRDLKPQNIGFKEIHPDHPERDVVALFDFGLARNLPTESKAKNEEGLFHMSLVGTRRYMAPEVVTTKTYNLKADTYSWALVFFEMITQQRPYDGIQRNEHKEYICRQGKRPKLYSYYGIPKELETMLRLSWAQDVSKRHTMSEVCDTLKAFLVGTIHENAVVSSKETDDVSVVDQDRIGSLATDLSLSDSSHTFDTEESHSTAGGPSENERSNNMVLFEEARAPVNLMDLHLPSNPTSGDTFPADTTCTQPVTANGGVPQAISMSTIGSLTTTRDPAAFYSADIPMKRRTSRCERIVAFFRTGQLS